MVYAAIIVFNIFINVFKSFNNISNWKIKFKYILYS